MVLRPDFDFGVEGADGDVVAERGRRRCFGILGGARRREVEPLEAEGEVRKHEIMVGVNFLLRFVVHKDLEAAEVAFGLCDERGGCQWGKFRGLGVRRLRDPAPQNK